MSQNTNKLQRLVQLASQCPIHMHIEFVMQGEGDIQVCYKFEAKTSSEKVKATIEGDNILITLPNDVEAAIVIKLVGKQSFIQLIDMVAEQHGTTDFFSKYKNFVKLKQLALSIQN